MTNVDPDTLADTVIGLDGPYDPTRIVLAGDVLAELARRLNHATIRPRAIRPRLTPAEAYSLLGSLHGLEGGLAQLFGQLGTYLEHLAAEPTLADTDAESSPATTARDAAADLRAAVVQTHEKRSRLLASAQSLVGHLYLDEDEGD